MGKKVFLLQGRLLRLIFWFEFIQGSNFIFSVIWDSFESKKLII